MSITYIVLIRKYVNTNILKMNELVNTKEYVTIKNYSIKYNICIRKIYRHVNMGLVEHVNIDGIQFISDRPYEKIYSGKNKNQVKNVKILTSESKNVKILTSKTSEVIDNEEVNNINNVKILTSESNNVKILTLYETNLLNKSKDSNDCINLTIKDWSEIQKIKEKLLKNI